MRRIVIAAAAVLLVGTLIVGLFDEARAVTITVQAPSQAVRTNTPSATFTVQVDVPQNERLPIQSVQAVIERTPTTTKANPTRVADVSCASVTTGCTQAQLTVATGPGVVTGIGFTGTTPNLAGYGIGNCGGYCYVTHTGFGYDNQDGFGVSQPGAAGTGYQLNDVGQGYGYANGNLQLTFTVTVDGRQLTRGTHWLTFNVNTGSGVLGDVQSQARMFQVSGFGGGGGGGGGGVQIGPGGTGNVGLGQTFSAQQGATVRVTSGLPSGVTGLEVRFARACQGCTLQIQTRTSGPLAGTPAAGQGLPTGFQGVRYYTLQVLDAQGNPVDGAIESGILDLELPRSELPPDTRARQMALLRFQEAQNGWRPLDTELRTPTNADPLGYRIVLPGFSEYALAADDEPPTLSSPRPTGTTSQVTPTIALDWTDNREIDPASLELTIDGQSANGANGNLRVTQAGFSYTPASALSTGQHTVEATVSDASGLEASRTWSFTVTAPGCPEPPQIISVRPADGATGIAPGSQVQVTVMAGSCDVTTGTLTLDGQGVPSFSLNVLAGQTGTATATLPSRIGANQTVQASLMVTDTGGNQQARDWSFTTQQEAEPPTPPEGDGGIPGWVWVLVVILAIVAVVGGWWYYDQQQGPGQGG